MTRDQNGRLHLDARWVGIIVALLSTALGGAVGFGYGKGTIDTRLKSLENEIVALHEVDKQMTLRLESNGQRLESLEKEMVLVHERQDTVLETLKMHRSSTERH